MKTIINTTNAPSPIGPYSHAVLTGNTLFTSGQIAFNVTTGLLVFDTIKLETEQVMQNLKAVLEAANMGFEHVVKTSIFISNMDNFAEINDVYARYFNPDTAPARETVQVARLPKDANVEISMIAVK